VICLQLLRKRWWLIPVVLPILTYAGLIIAAYISPPLRIGGYSTGRIPEPAAVIEVENHGWWPVTLTGVEVKGVLPPDEVGALTTTQGEMAQIASLIPPRSPAASGDLKGWQVGPKERRISHGVRLNWYQTQDLRWLDCPAVHYRYLLWPFTARARNYCSDTLRGAASYGGPLPAGLGEWGPWQSVPGGVRYRTQRLTEERGDELWIELEPDEGAPQVGLTLNRFVEEPGGGRARFKMGVVTLEGQPAVSRYFTVPLRWGEPTPDIQMEVVSSRDL